jgi:hypothetical protein
MGRNQTTSDLEHRVVTYVSVEKEDRFFGSRLGSWINENMSRRSFDFGLGAAGAGTALASVIFAGVMMMGDNSHPQFGGAEYLLLFTRPLQSAAVTNPPMAAARHRELGIDYSATGSIGTAARQKTPESIDDATGPTPNTSRASASPQQLRKDYKVTNVSGGVATLRGQQGSLVVETGSLMPNGDIVVSIDRRAGHWVVVTSGGLIEAQ